MNLYVWQKIAKSIQIRKFYLKFIMPMSRAFQRGSTHLYSARQKLKFSVIYTLKIHVFIRKYRPIFWKKPISYRPILSGRYIGRLIGNIGYRSSTSFNFTHLGNFWSISKNCRNVKILWPIHSVRPITDMAD